MNPQAAASLMNLVAGYYNVIIISILNSRRKIITHNKFIALIIKNNAVSLHGKLFAPCFLKIVVLDNP